MMKHNVNKKCNSNYFLLERQSLLIFNKYKLKEGEITENAVFDLFYSNHKFLGNTHLIEYYLIFSLDRKFLLNLAFDRMHFLSLD